MKQTAVDFIIEKLAENGVLHSSDIWMAKSIEKVNIENAFESGDLFSFSWFDGVNETSTNYYNETFNK